MKYEYKRVGGNLVTFYNNLCILFIHSIKEFEEESLFHFKGQYYHIAYQQTILPILDLMFVFSKLLSDPLQTSRREFLN